MGLSRYTKKVKRQIKASGGDIVKGAGIVLAPFTAGASLVAATAYTAVKSTSDSRAAVKAEDLAKAQEAEYNAAVAAETARVLAQGIPAKADMLTKEQTSPVSDRPGGASILSPAAWGSGIAEAVRQNPLGAACAAVVLTLGLVGLLAILKGMGR